MRELEGATAFVTGGAGDIGAAIGAELQRRGAHVTLADLKACEEAGPYIGRADRPEEIEYRQVDVTDRAAVDMVFSEHGAFDLILANAGIGDLRPFLEITSDAWERMIAVNLTGVFHTAQAGARALVEAGKPGRIVLTGSWVGSVPWPGNSHYSAAKAGVQMLARSMARELAGNGIRVNVVAPGIVAAGVAGEQMRTDPVYARRARGVVPLGDYQTPEDVAAAAAFLCGPGARAITGTVLTVDGGCSLFKFSDD